MVKAKKFLYIKAFEGEPTLDNFKLEEEELGDLKDEEILCEAKFLSVDPYVRALMGRFPINHTVIGRQIAKVIDSKNKNFPVGCHIFGTLGWRTHTIVKPANSTMDERAVMSTDTVYILPDFGNLPLSYGLGCLGVPGNTAHFGFLEICQPKAGETVVVTGAAGAVGCIVGQIAKIKGCNVIGFAGSDEKCKWLTNDLGFDYAFNYKTENIVESLKNSAPNGVDCYFDNVGGEISSAIISQMNKYGRISVCGSISTYNSVEVQKAPLLQPFFVRNELKMEGFMVFRWASRYMEGLQQNLKWTQEGKIKYKETRTKGFENTPQAFIDMLRGKNFGKALVEI